KNTRLSEEVLHLAIENILNGATPKDNNATTFSPDTVPEIVTTANTGTDLKKDTAALVDSAMYEIYRVLKSSFPGWTVDTTSSHNGFQARKDSATWVDNKMSFKKSYADFFGKELILRKDNFESIAVVRLENKFGSTLFTNHPSGNISFGDSTVSHIQSKSMFEWDS